MIADADLAIRAMTRPELDIALDWAADEGWNPGLADAHAFHAADPEGFLIGLVRGRPAGAISVVRYGEDFGFLGFYLVAPEFRGQGVGWRIWQAGMARLAGRNVGLDGVPAQQENYRKSGFVLAHRNVRHAGTASGTMPTLPAGVRLVQAADRPFAEIAEYDRTCFPAAREAFLRRWLAPPHGRALAIVEDARLVGYGVIRACRDGHKIGPLFADTPALAHALFLGLAAAAGTGATVFLDVPASNPHAIALAARHDLAPVFETARMYTGAAPALGQERIYGITSFELG